MVILQWLLVNYYWWYWHSQDQRLSSQKDLSIREIQRAYRRIILMENYFYKVKFCPVGEKRQGLWASLLFDQSFVKPNLFLPQTFKWNANCQSFKKQQQQPGMLMFWSQYVWKLSMSFRRVCATEWETFQSLSLCVVIWTWDRSFDISVCVEFVWTWDRSFDSNLKNVSSSIYNICNTPLGEC